MTKEIRLECFELALQIDSSNVDSAISIAKKILAFVEDDDDEPKQKSGRSKVQQLLDDREEREEELTYEEEMEETAEVVEEILKDKDPERAAKIDELVSELDSTNRIVMRKLLERVETKYLQSAYNEYLSKVLKT